MEDDDRRHLIQRPNRHYWSNPGILLLLISQFFERMGYYGFLMNVVFFLNSEPYSWSAYDAVLIILISHCATYFMSIVAAVLSDAWIGKFTIMMIGYAMYLASVFMPIMYLDTWNGSIQTNASDVCMINRGIDHYDPPKHLDIHLNLFGIIKHKKDYRNFFDESCSIVMILTILSTCTGAAFIKAVVTPYGADQCSGEYRDDNGDFFYCYYWVINIGILISYSAVSFVEVNISMFWGYMGSFIAIVFSLIALLCGRFLFRHETDGDAPMSIKDITAILCCTCCCNGNNENEHDVQPLVRPKCLDKAKIIKGGRYDSEKVDDVKRLIHILLVFIPLMFYWASYFQVESLFQSQALHMVVPELYNGFTVPVTWLIFFDSLTVLLLIPFLNGVVYPSLRRHGLCPSVYTKMGIGMVLSFTSILIAGIVERKRMTTFWGEGNPSASQPWGFHAQIIGDTTFYAANMSVFYLVPQYFFSGTAEVLVIVPGLDYAYTAAPNNMKSFSTGMFWLISGLGSLLGMSVLEMVKGSLVFSSDKFDINYRQPCEVNGTLTDNWCKETRLDIYFYILAALQLGGLIVYVLCVKCLLNYCGATQLGNEPLLMTRTCERLTDADSVDLPFNSGRFRDDFGNTLTSEASITNSLTEFRI